MYFALVAHDRSGAVADRQRIRSDHLKYLDELGDRLIMAGPFLNAQGEGIGSIVIIEAETLEDARVVFGQDPYAREGLFDSITIKPWRLFISKLPQ